jgi:hypothetical protein
MLRVFIISPRPRFRGLDLGLVLWPSFLAACFGSLLFFAAVDPLLLREAGPGIFHGIERDSGYLLGFLFFWALASGASALSVFLVRSQNDAGAARPPGSRN